MSGMCDAQCSGSLRAGGAEAAVERTAVDLAASARGDCRGRGAAREHAREVALWGRGEAVRCSKEGAAEAAASGLLDPAGGGGVEERCSGEGRGAAV